jgi:hypothetical protein
MRKLENGRDATVLPFWEALSFLVDPEHPGFPCTFLFSRRCDLSFFASVYRAGIAQVCSAATR